MGDEIKVPRDLLEQVANIRLPPTTDLRLQALMDRNNDGRLNRNEVEELKILADWSENISLMRAQALRCLGRKPS